MIKVIVHKNTARIRISAFESLNNHTSVWEEMNKTLGFYNQEDAEYFVNAWDGKHDYREAMDKDKEVPYAVFIEGANGTFQDDYIKEVGWKPYW
tara:strand:- start:63 stop:344 length:282 start_codon:yes stop_codon:yes gene_type:complete